MITIGFIGGPSGSPSAQAVQVDPTDPTTKTVSASILLKTAYYPGAVPDVRASFPNGNVPRRCLPNECIFVPYYEAAALVALGAASWM